MRKVMKSKLLERFELNEAPPDLVRDWNAIVYLETCREDRQKVDN